MEFIIAQILSGISLILLCIGYFFRKKPHFILIQTASNLFYAVAFIVLKAYVAGIVSLISIIRCIYIYIAEKKDFKHTEAYLGIFVIVNIIITAVFWESWLDLIPLITSTMFTFILAIKDMQLLRYVSIVPNVILGVYSILKRAYVNSVLDFIEVIVIIVAIIKFKKEKIDFEKKKS